MFEKEAEDNKPPYAFCAIDTKCELWKDGFQKGAEFGFNKANEWHYVKNILPEEDVYVYLLCKGDDFPVVARRHIFYGKTEWEWDCKWGSGFQLKADNEKIIAWKEIVLPKEIGNDRPGTF